MRSLFWSSFSPFVPRQVLVQPLSPFSALKNAIYKSMAKRFALLLGLYLSVTCGRTRVVEKRRLSPLPEVVPRRFRPTPVQAFPRIPCAQPAGTNNLHWRGPPPSGGGRRVPSPSHDPSHPAVGRVPPSSLPCHQAKAQPGPWVDLVAIRRPRYSLETLLPSWPYCNSSGWARTGVEWSSYLEP
jgi:hypothetical protein